MKIYIAKNRQQLGPFDEERLIQQVAMGEFSCEDLACAEGMTEWRPLNELITVKTSPMRPFQRFKRWAKPACIVAGFILFNLIAMWLIDRFFGLI